MTSHDHVDSVFHMWGYNCPDLASRQVSAVLGGAPVLKPLPANNPEDGAFTSPFKFEMPTAGNGGVTVLPMRIQYIF